MKNNKVAALLSITLLIIAGCALKKKIDIQDNCDGSSSKININNETIVKTTTGESEINNEIKEINGFVLLSSFSKDIIIDLKYATSDNFTKRIVYPDNICVLRKNTAEKLVNANNELMKLGYKLKVWDAYRPLHVQKIFWDIVPDSRFVANPNTGGSIHNKGCAVDVTLVDKNGNELKMPTGFDDFTPNAYRNNSNISDEVKKNLEILTNAMVNSGFTTLETEWWHFQDADSRKYEISDLDLSLFKK